MFEREYLVIWVQFQHRQAQLIFQKHQSQRIRILDSAQHLLDASCRSKIAVEVIFRRFSHLPLLKKNTCSIPVSCNEQNEIVQANKLETKNPRKFQQIECISRLQSYTTLEIAACQIAICLSEQNVT